MWLATFILLAVALTGGAVFELGGQRIKGHLSLVLAFGGAYLIGLIFTHLVPEAYAMSGKTGWYVVLGFLLQGLLEYGSKGIEHGHSHSLESVHGHSHGKVLPLGAFISLCLHALIESMPLAEGSGHGAHAGHDHAGHVHVHVADLASLDWQLLLGLGLHKLPVALVLMALMHGLGVGVWKRWTMLIIFGLMPLAGMGLYDVLIHSGASWVNTLPMVTQGLVIGILLHISTTILFEADEGHRFNLQKLLATIVGLGLAVVTVGL